MAEKRITASVDEELHRRLKSSCANHGIKIKDAITEAVQSWLERRK